MDAAVEEEEAGFELVELARNRLPMEERTLLVKLGSLVMAGTGAGLSLPSLFLDFLFFDFLVVVVVVVAGAAAGAAAVEAGTGANTASSLRGDSCDTTGTGVGEWASTAPVAPVVRCGEG